MPDFQTMDFYKRHGDKIFEHYRSMKSPLQTYFKESFSRAGRILDIGSGSARDLLSLLGMGYDAFGIEPVEELINLARQKNPGLEERLLKGALPQINHFLKNSFDGILCSAVLMHIPDEDFFDSAYMIRNLLKEGGRLLFSVPVSRQDMADRQRDIKGRLMIIRPLEKICLVFERLGFKKIRTWENRDSQGRAIVWKTVLLQLDYLSARPLDEIESIINRDKKTATYKLALLRALCAIATGHDNRAVWVSRDKIGIPMADIVLKWLIYYWPVFAGPVFIPQITGEQPGNKGNHIRFRKELTELISYYGTSGLNQFLVDLYHENLDRKAEQLLAGALKRIREAIIRGPVRFSGQGLFAYENDLLLFPTRVWREFCLMGHWIQDALVLRWAELTASISKHEIEISQAAQLLLTQPDLDRITGISRTYFDQKDHITCVWSGIRLKKYHIDHVIPFSLWHNNDLWNLLPADKNLNMKKSDKLPTRYLLQKQKDIIIDHWQFLSRQSPRRFQREINRFGGQRINLKKWENPLFHTLAEAVEYTALQRGIERWQPAERL